MRYRKQKNSILASIGYKQTPIQNINGSWAATTCGTFPEVFIFSVLVAFTVMFFDIVYWKYQFDYLSFDRYQLQ